MGTVYSTTNTAPLQYPSTTYMDRHRSNGGLYVISKNSTANQYGLQRSGDGGGSWGQVATFSRSNLVEMGSMFIGRDGWVRLVYRTNESSQDRIYIRGLNTATNVWENELLLSAVGNGGSAGSVYQGMDLWQTVTGNTEYYVCAVGYTSGGNHGVKLLGAYTRPIPSLTVADSSFITGTRQWLVSGSGRITPSIDASHSGDGKTASNPHLWVSFGRTGAYLVKLAWNGNGWSGPTTPVTLATGLTAMDALPGRWDGIRSLTATRTGSTVSLWERNAGNTTSVERVSPTHPQGTVRSWAFNYNTDTKDVRVYAVGTTINDLHHVDYVRASDTWGSWVVTSATDILGAGVDNWNLRRSSYGNTKYDVLTAHSGAPNTIVHTAQTFTYTPLAPVWNVAGQVYVNPGAKQWNTTLPLAWTFRDVDPGSLQTAYAIRRQIGAGAFAFWRASDNTWQAAEVKNLTATQSITVPANWATSAAEADHVYWIKTWNTADQTAGYSTDTIKLTPSDKVNPAITAPADSSTVTSATVNITWTCTDQRAFQVQTFIFGILLADTGKIIDSVSRSYDSGLLKNTDGSQFLFANGFNYSIRVYTWNAEDLQSDFSQSNISVVFVAPATPTLVVTPVPASGWNAVAITNPTPSGGQPAVDSQEVFRRIVGDSSAGTRVAKALASGATYNDWRAVDGINYEYRVNTLGVNGANVFSAWTA